MTPVWDDRAASWVSARIGNCERGFDAARVRALAVIDAHDQMAAGVVFHSWWPEQGTIQLSCAATNRRWLTRRVAAAVWSYAFAVSRLAVAQTSERNDPVRRIWKACGASETLVPELFGPGEAAVILTLTPEQWAASKLSGKPDGP